MAWVLEVTAFVACLLSAIIWYLKRRHSYWKDRGVPYVEPVPIFGNMRDIFLSRKNFAEAIGKLYVALEGNKFGGFYIAYKPALLIRDPDLMRSVLVKDFAHFQHRGLKVDEKHDPMSTNLFNLGGPKWRALRSKLSPTFTSGKMKFMFGLMERCALQLQDHLKPYAARHEILEMKDIHSRFTTDVIGACAFGIQCNSLVNPDSEFRSMGKAIFTSSLGGKIRAVMNFLLVKLAKKLHIRMVSKEVEHFFTSVVKETIQFRKKNNVERNDFIQLLIQLKERGKVDEDHEVSKMNDQKTLDSHEPIPNAADDFELTDELLTAQCFVFFLAGFETSSTTMSFCLYELTRNPDIQERLREEIDTVIAKHNGHVTYDGIMEMHYLDKVISETLRKYPPAGNLSRSCTIPYTIPETNVRIEHGTRVLIPIYAVHHDAKYYPDPERFDPERFSEEAKATRPHFTYYPFGEGPRICIGMRFGLLQTKVGMVALLSKYRFSPCEKTPPVIRFDPRAVVTSSIDGIHVRIEPRN